MNNQYNEEEVLNDNSSNPEGEYIYKSVMKNKENRRTLSIISLVLSVLSILLLFIPWLSLIFGIASVVVGGLSRRNLGYFDKLSLAAIIIGIFGCVFSVVGMIFGELIIGLFM